MITLDFAVAAWLFLLGAIFGSFMNVLILRYKPGESLFGKQLLGRSKCPKCGKTLGPLELIPIFSFIFQAGKCRGCGKPISIQYPIVEFLTGMAFASIPFFVTPWYAAAIWIAAASLMIVLSVIDLKHFVIPDMANALLVILGAGYTALVAKGLIGATELVPGTFLGSYAYIFSFTANPIISHLLAAVALASFFALIIILTKGKAMGWGDVKLAAGIGLLLGWPDGILAIAIAFVLGAIFGIVFLIRKKKTMKDALPFGPFISAGAIITMMFGYEIISAYFRFLNLGA